MYIINKDYRLEDIADYKILVQQNLLHLWFNNLRDVFLDSGLEIAVVLK